MTRLDRARAEAAAREPAWDDVRERRVLARIKQARAAERERARLRWAWLTPPRLGLGVALAGTAAALALALTLDLDSSSREQPLASGPAVEPPTATPASEPAPDLAEPNGADEPSRMRLPDGSLAQLGPGARIDIPEFGAGRIVIEQPVGEVRYEVTPDPEREFVVRSRGVEVRVIGTVFSIVAGDARVLVEVERGRVEVLVGERRSQLGPGDSLGIQLDGLAPASEPTEDPTERSEPAKPGKRVDAPSVDELLARVDTARLAGDDAGAAELLRAVLREHGDDPRAATAAFTLGRVERSRGRHRAAARAFADYLQRSPHGVLAEDASAEQARSWADAGELERARAAALRSLSRWPTGTHAERMRELAGE